jgi:hypothetical protein
MLIASGFLSEVWNDARAGWLCRENLTKQAGIIIISKNAIVFCVGRLLVRHVLIDFLRFLDDPTCQSIFSPTSFVPRIFNADCSCFSMVEDEG